MPTTTQFVISGQSRPGVMAEVASVLAAAGVNIKAFSAPEVTGTGKLRLLVADVEGARTALRGAKIKFTEETALILSLENKPGALNEAYSVIFGEAVDLIVSIERTDRGRQVRDVGLRADGRSPGAHPGSRGARTTTRPSRQSAPRSSRPGSRRASSRGSA